MAGGKNTGDFDFGGQKTRSAGEAPGHPEVKPTRMPGANTSNGTKGSGTPKGSKPSGK